MLPQGLWSRKQKTPGGELVSQGTKLKGDLHALQGGGFHGSLEGSLHVEGLVIVGSAGSVKGGVQAIGCRAEGAIEGPIHTEGETSLEKDCRVRSAIRARALRIEAGADFQGELHIGE